jgi:diacylglycerol kinase family enzyme
MQEKIPAKNVLIGVIPSGTGNDWIKSHGIPLDYKKALSIVIKKKTKTQDLGKIEVLGNKPGVYHFINYAGAGFDCFVLSRLKQYKKFGPLSYFLCAIANFMKFKNIPVTIELDALKIKSSVFLLGVGLCSFTGGGMRLTKDADPFDGYFNITVAQDFTKFDIIKNLPKLFNGGIFKDKKVFTYKSKKVKIFSAKEGVVSQIDGEVLEKGSLVYSIVKGGFTFCSP